jgi:hypothetical protein
MPDAFPSDPGVNRVASPAANAAKAEAIVEAPAPPRQTAQPVAVEPSATRATIRLEKKHPLAIRWMHWINFPVLFTMIWSGLLIYWGDSDNAYQHPHRVYRIGIGAWTLFRFFPEWVYRWLNAPYQITTGLGWHLVFMWIFALNGWSMSFIWRFRGVGG